VAAQYTRYEPLPGVHLKGDLTLGENIADIGGVKVAFRAYRALRAGAKVVTVADGFDEDQQFFLAWGQTWCTKQREEFARMLVDVDPHSPGRFRVDGVLADEPEFATAFRCAPNTPMNPPDRCEIW
jgi:putative endopeptidase